MTELVITLFKPEIRVTLASSERAAGANQPPAPTAHRPVVRRTLALRRSAPWFVGALVVGLVVGWAGRAVFAPVDAPDLGRHYTFASVEPGSVGSSLDLNAVATWNLRVVGINRATGVVTSVNMRNREFGPGARVFTVGLRPVVLAEGVIPAFRTIAPGTRGADVSQLQTLLASLDFYHHNVDGLAGAATVAAVKAWQKSLGEEPDGIVRAGDVIYVPHLPARLSLDPSIVTQGASLIGGEKVLREIPRSPQITVTMTPAQASMVHERTPVKLIAASGATWTGQVGDSRQDSDSGNVTLEITGAHGNSICATDCTSIPIGRETLLPAHMVTVATVQGLVVPTAALTTTSAGGVDVITRAGERMPVRVLASANGMSAVSGLSRGVEVRLPAEADD